MLQTRYFGIVIIVSLFVCFTLNSTLLAQTYDLSGRVYEGNEGQEPAAGATALENVTVKLWPSNNSGIPYTDSGPVDQTTTNSEGWYSLSVDLGDYYMFEYFIIEEVDKSGYYSTGATSVSGSKISNNRIQYTVGNLISGTRTGNKFWDKPVVETAPDIEVFWNGVLINDGSSSPLTVNGTDFGSTTVSGGTVSKTYTIENTGNASLSITGVTLTGSHAADFSVTTSPSATIAAGATTTFTVEFDPGAAGTRSATVNIVNNTSSKNPYNYNIQGEGTVATSPEIDIRGNGIPIPDGDVTPQLSDGTDMGNTQINSGAISSTFTIHNIGSADLTLSDVSIYPDNYPGAASFGIVPGWSSPSIPPGTSVSIGVECYPYAVGTYETILSVQSNDADENPYTIIIQATGTSSAEQDKDYGDAPDGIGIYRYPTLASNNGAFHYIDPDVFLGLKIDAEADGITSSNADGDDSDNQDDDDGIVFMEALIPGQTPRVDVTASIEGYLAGWLDFNQDGDWDSTETVFSNQVLTPGLNVLAITIPSDAVLGTTCGRFRFSTSMIYSTLGSMPDGEVEDYQVEIQSDNDTTKGSIQIYKILTPSDPNVIFQFTGDLGNFQLSANSNSKQFNNLNPGNYSVTETIPSGWAQGTFQITGDLDAGTWLDHSMATIHIDLDFGENITIIIYNYIPQEHDFGDAPSPYPTLVKDNGAYHLISNKYKFGSSVDADSDGQPDAACLGDDNDGNDDEEGNISFNGGLLSLNNGSITIDPLGEIAIGIWLDCDHDGSWTNNGGIFTVYNDSPSQVTLDFGLVTFNIPLKPGLLNIRIRVFGDPLYANGFTGYGGPGEVEDYQYNYTEENWAYDYGDAPSSYGVTLQTGTIPDDGGRHPIVQGVHLGASIDEEPDGLPDANAGGDDNDNSDDEDGVQFTSQLIAGQSATVNVTASIVGYLNAWIDLNQDGDWDDSGERILNEESLTAGVNSVSLNIPGTAKAGGTFARFRFSTEKLVLNVQNYKRYLAKDGEVEDYKITIQDNSESEERDYGDAPASYPSASHLIGGPYFGPSAATGKPDVENGMLSFSTSADWDDNNGIDDEDGFISFTQSPIQSHIWFLQIDYYNLAKQWITMGIWVDTDRDGDWDLQDAYNNSISNNYYSKKICFMIPSGLFNPGLTTFRARIVEGQNVSLTADGDFGPGEVEDHQIVLPDPGDDLPEGGYIFGRKWNDQNGDGLYQSGEPILSGWTIYIDSNTNGQYDTGEPSQVTDGSGYYLFFGLAADTYEVGEVYQSGWTQTFPGGSGMHSVTVNPSSSLIPSHDFGNTEDGTGGLGAIKWYQPPLLHEIEDPDTLLFQGWIETSTSFMPILADDWFCFDPRPVTAIRWWGAYANWDTTFAPPNAPGEFHIGVWNDVYEDAEELEVPWNHLGELIHEWIVSRGDAGEQAIRGVYLPEMQDSLITGFQYSVILPQPDWFYQEGDSTVYWLSITALYEEEPDSLHWGWLTREHHFHSDAMRMHFDHMPELATDFQNGESIAPRWDAAFILGTEEDAGQFDFGNAPQTGYKTLKVNNGAYHRIVPGVCLGELVDHEEDGQPDLDALGDDHADDWDEEGVAFTETLFAGQDNDIFVRVSANGFLNAWLDIHGDSSWYEPEDHVLEEIEMGPGKTLLQFFVPEDAVSGPTVMRFRFSRERNVWFNGFAMDGEVEDYMITIQSDTDVKQQHVEIPSEFKLYSNYPNPFNPSTQISFAVPERGQVILEIYNIRGKRVKTLVNETKDAGFYTTTWYGTDENNRQASTGLYLCRMKTRDYHQTIRMLYIR